MDRSAQKAPSISALTTVKPFSLSDLDADLICEKMQLYGADIPKLNALATAANICAAVVNPKRPVARPRSAQHVRAQCQTGACSADSTQAYVSVGSFSFS